MAYSNTSNVPQKDIKYLNRDFNTLRNQLIEYTQTYYPETFWLTVNGNGGFVGKLLSETFLISLVYLNKQITYYFLVISRC